VRNSLTIALFASIIVLVLMGFIFSSMFSPNSDVVLPYVDSVLIIATDILNLLGGAIVFYGAILVIVKFVQTKLKDPYQKSGALPYLSGYLTLSLELFIGAEIIKTAVTRDFNSVEVLILIILSRGLFSLILYLERRWHGAGTETE
jgi:uncharacterized membrane protein